MISYYSSYLRLFLFFPLAMIPWASLTTKSVIHTYSHMLSIPSFEAMQCLKRNLCVFPHDCLLNIKWLEFKTHNNEGYLTFPVIFFNSLKIVPLKLLFSHFYLHLQHHYQHHLNNGHHWVRSHQVPPLTGLGSSSPLPLTCFKVNMIIPIL